MTRFLIILHQKNLKMSLNIIKKLKDC